MRAKQEMLEQPMALKVMNKINSKLSSKNALQCTYSATL